MELEKLISEMLHINIQSRLWHWMTDSVQQHTTYETFLTQNETFMDSLVESALGNDISINFKQVQAQGNNSKDFDLKFTRDEIKKYRKLVSDYKNKLSTTQLQGADELVTILDDVTELSSKTLYLLKLK